MAPRSRLSAQTLAVLAALVSEPRQWQHGYALAKQTQLKSGTLYPILIRLADRRLVEACWEDEPAPGRPRRHQYRLTAEGHLAAAAALAAAEQTGRARVAADQSGRARPAPRGVPAGGIGTAHASAEVPS